MLKKFRIKAGSADGADAPSFKGTSAKDLR